jgi:3-isopropylmalate/(R)-2-methylmalate dehydratase small subunit
MNTKDYILDAVMRFKTILDSHTKQFESFDKHAIQVEGWLKGELALFFDNEKIEGKLDEFDAEVGCGLGRKKVDFKLVFKWFPVWIELKHWQIGYQGEERWKASNYFGSKGIGIYNDVEKLSNIIDGEKYLLILATKNPESEEAGDWVKGLTKFSQKFPQFNVKSYTNPSNLMKLKGKVFKYGADVNTDVIIPARYLNVSDPDELAKHCMEDIDADFLKKVRAGDIIMATTNFGCGSSREHAPLAIKTAGISCVIAKSFARIFFRNAINIGLPLLECAAAVERTDSGDILEVDLAKGKIKNITKGKTFTAKPYPDFMSELIAAGGLVEYTKKRLASTNA